MDLTGNDGKERLHLVGGSERPTTRPKLRKLEEGGNMWPAIGQKMQELFGQLIEGIEPQMFNGQIQVRFDVLVHVNEKGQPFVRTRGRTEIIGTPEPTPGEPPYALPPEPEKPGEIPMGPK